MNKRNPVDWFFKRKLHNYSVDVPMELWSRIDAQREQQKQLALRDRNRWSVLLLFLFFIAAGISSLILLSSTQEEPALSNFPIMIQPMAGTPDDPASNIAEDSAPVLSEVLAAKSQEVINTPVSLAVPQTIAEPKVSPALPLEAFTPKAITDQEDETQFNRAAIANMTSLPSIAHFAKKKNKHTNGVKCADFNPEEKGRWTLDILASPEWSFRSLTPKESAFAEYVENREATESPSFTYSASIRASYIHPSGFLGRIGLNYSQINEKFESRTEREEIITIRKIYGPLGDVIGTDTLTETKINRSYTNNRFESIDIPVIFGYEKQLKKLSISANAGLLFNVLFRSKGDFLSPMNGKPVSFDETLPDSYPAFRNSLGIGLYAGVSLSYPVNPKLSFVVEPHLKTYPKTVTRDQYVVNQKYLLTGLSIGVRHRM